MFNKGAVEIVVPQDTGRQFFISCTSEKGFGDKFVDIFCIYVSLFLICITALSSATWLEPLLHLEQNFDVFVSLCCTANCFFFHINTQWGDWPPELDEERINYLSQMVQESEVQLVCLNPQTQLPMGKENLLHTVKDGISNEDCLPIESEESGTHPRHSLDKEAGLPCCRVCQCAEPDTRGDNVLSLLGITPPLQEASKSYGEAQPNRKEVLKDVENNFSLRKNIGREAGLAEFISPDGEVFICSTDLEMGPGHHQDTLVELGCSCKNDLALVHYACALKWFVNHGSTVCEICGHVAKNIRTADFKKVVGSLKEFGSLRERTASGEPIPALVPTNQGADPDAVASIRRLQLIEISMWFNPHNNNNYNNSAAVSQVVSEQPLNTVSEDVVPDENPATKWAVEGTGILLATGLLTVTLAWLIAPRVGKKTARSGLHILLGGICALTVVVFFRFFVLTRIKYGPARYWAILFVFWFLVFGIWASRTHGAHAT